MLAAVDADTAVDVCCVCVDIDECREQPRVCGINGTCRNTVGAYRCRCHTGFYISPDGTCSGISRLTHTTH